MKKKTISDWQGREERACWCLEYNYHWQKVKK